MTVLSYVTHRHFRKIDEIETRLCYTSTSLTNTYLIHFFLAGYNCINIYRFKFTLITNLFNGNFNNGVVMRPFN
jgi:hypothetical protein